MTGSPLMTYPAYDAVFDKYGMALFRLLSADPGFPRRFTTPETVFAEFAKTDPTGGDATSPYRHLSWIARTYIALCHGYRTISADCLSRVHKQLCDVEALHKKFPKRDFYIEDLESFSDLQNRLSVWNGTHRLTGADLFARVEEKVLKESSVLYQGKEGYVVMPHSQRAAEYWAQGTSWLELEDSNITNMFHTLNDKPVIMLYTNGDQAGRYFAEGLDDFLKNDLGARQSEPSMALKRLMLKACSQNPGLSYHMKLIDVSPEKPALNAKDQARMLAFEKRMSAEEQQVLDTELLRGTTPGQREAIELIQSQHTTKHLTLAQWDDPTIVSAVIHYSPSDFKHASERWRGNRYLVRDAVRALDENMLECAPYLMKDREFVLSLVKENGKALRYAPIEWRYKQDMIAAALENTLSVFEFIPRDVWRKLPKNMKQRAFNREALHNWTGIRFAPDCDASLPPRQELQAFLQGREENPLRLHSMMHIFPSLRPGCFVKEFTLDEAERIIRKAAVQDTSHGLRLISNDPK